MRANVDAIPHRDAHSAQNASKIFVRARGAAKVMRYSAFRPPIAVTQQQRDVITGALND